MESPPPAAVAAVPDGANRTAPGWTASPPARTRPRRAIVVGAVAAAVLGLAAVARTLSSREALPATGDVAPQSIRACGHEQPHASASRRDRRAVPLVTPAPSASSPPRGQPRGRVAPVPRHRHGRAARHAPERGASAEPPPARAHRGTGGAQAPAPVGLPSHI